MANMRKLRAHMIEHGISVDDLAERINVNRATAYRWFADNGKQITINNANAIRKALDLTPEKVYEIFFDSDLT